MEVLNTEEDGKRGSRDWHGSKETAMPLPNALGEPSDSV